MVPRYVLQLLLSENKQNYLKNSTTTKAREKISGFEILRILEIFWCMFD